ncbi:hypothetical protein A6770_36565 [Nostoc minutum NIES-26]|uniref:Uncharacterized protein n=1 Tax=Nostoc minutum NIES-26 TaxID=1844469 RepID=A0A367RWY9_9NOSO|nr:hypothetical protein A6770_36565 [Nostoc minutum NIES-26]
MCIGQIAGVCFTHVALLVLSTIYSQLIPRELFYNLTDFSNILLDTYRAAAEKADAEAKKSDTKTTLITQVIAKHEEALKYWRLTKDLQKALQSYQEQLAPYQEMGLLAEQAQSLYNIAKLQRQNNQLQAALTEKLQVKTYVLPTSPR